MGTRLYVGNLPYDADEGGLRDAFAQDGRVVERVSVVIDRETGRPRGFAFVEMASEDDARKAITAMDGASYGGRALRVSEAEERRPGGPSRGPGGPPRSGGFGGGAPRPGGGGFRGPAGPETASGGGGPPPRAFGEDAPKGGRKYPEKKAPRRRHDSEDDFGGRRGGFDDDEE